ncbi:MAG: TetR family transcriptional regulator [Solirubrobacteraceae bacterium]
MPRGQFDRSERKAATRARLLEAAARVYARSGFAGATLDEVAGEAGFTKGAVYAHFGSKENLLLALLQEHLTGQIAEQLELFDRVRSDRERATWERPLAGSDSWMRRLGEDPDPFRLFVELWSYAQRDADLRERLASGLDALRATFVSFGVESAADAGVQTPHAAHEQFANALLGLILGLGLLKLADPDTVPDRLLGVVSSILIRALESDPQARQQLAALPATARA